MAIMPSKQIFIFFSLDDSVVNLQCGGQAHKVHETITLFANLPNIHRLKKFTDRLSNKPFLMWLLTIPPHLKYVAIVLPSNLSLIACFADTNVSQGSAATYARCGGIFSNHFTVNLLGSLVIFLEN